MAKDKQQKKEQKAILIRLSKTIGRNRLLVVAAAICAIISSILILFGTLLSGRGINVMFGVNKVDFSALRVIVIEMVFCYAIGGLLLWLTSFFANKLAYKTAAQIRSNLFTRMMQMPLSFFDTKSHGDIMSRMSNDIDTLSDGLVQVISKLFSGVAVLVFSLVFMFLISPPITLVVLCLTPFSLLLAQMISSRGASSFRSTRKSLSELNGYSEEMLEAQELVLLYGYQNKANEQFQEIDEELDRHGFRSQYYSSLVNPASRLINHIVYVAVSVLGGYLSIKKGTINIGDLSALLIYAIQFAKPINEITSVSSQFQAAIASAGRLFELMDEPVEEPDSETAIVLQDAIGNIEFNDVNFAYSQAKPLIENLSFVAKAGDTVAIVGPTGAGKTTLVNLLMRFYEVDKGQIFLDAQDIDGITRNSLRRHFGMVLQDSWIFEGTVRDNLAYGRPDATDEEVVEAAKAAFAHNFIRRLPQGYETVINMKSGLSQGQLQLLTIARAMLTDPSMLILDEATSSIDTRTEREIQKALLRMMNGRTSFVIAHRLSTIRNADLIIVMKDGHIIEQGTHMELMSKQSFYRQLHDSQFNE